MVRLITQNLLSCPSKVCSYPQNFPLSFQNVQTINIVEAEFNEGFLRGFMSRIEWDALRKSAGEVSIAALGKAPPCASLQLNQILAWFALQLGNTDLPEQSPNLADPESIPIELLQKLHHILLEVGPCERPSHPVPSLSLDLDTDLSALTPHSAIADPGSGRCYGLPELQPHLPHQGGYPQHGQSPSSSSLPPSQPPRG